ncbi:hypothetical protein D3C87_1759750 [compost metagenome]
MLQHRLKTQVVVHRELVQLSQRFRFWFWFWRWCWLRRNNWRDRSSHLQIVQTQIESAVEVGQCRFRGLRFVQQQVLDVLRIQLGGDRRSSQTTRYCDCHRREAAFQFFDPGEVIAVGHQLTLLSDERIAVALLTVDFHQL